MNTSEAKKMNRIQNSPEINHKKTGQNKVHMKVTESGKITKSEKYIYIFYSHILVLFSDYIVFYSSQTDKMNRELQTYETTVDDEKLINEELTLEVKELKQPERNTKIAKENGLKIQDNQVKKANLIEE